MLPPSLLLASCVAGVATIAGAAMLEHAGEFGDLADDDDDEGPPVAVTPPAPADAAAAAAAARTAAADSAGS